MSERILNDRQRAAIDAAADAFKAGDISALELIDRTVAAVQEVVRFRCTCRTLYETRAEAEECFATEQAPRFKVGDVVTAEEFRFGWFDGDRAWVKESRPSDRAYSGRELTFFYVVTAVDVDPRDPHRARYHLRTRAMSNPDGYGGGYTFHDRGGSAPTLVEDPPELPGLAALLELGPTKSLL